MALMIRRQIITPTASTPTSAGTNARRYITIHETANTSRGAGAQAHATLQAKGNSRAASWHWQVDDREAIQSWAHTVRCWHAGDGGGLGLTASIAIEVCVNSDGNYLRALANAAELTRMIMRDEGIPASQVVQHNRWSGKNCPAQLRAGTHGMTWAGFTALLTQQPTQKEDEMTPDQMRELKDYIDAKISEARDNLAGWGFPLVVARVTDAIRTIPGADTVKLDAILAAIADIDGDALGGSINLSDYVLTVTRRDPGPEDPRPGEDGAA